MARAGERGVGIAREDARERRAHVLAAGVVGAAGLGAARALEDAIVGHERHQRVDVVAIPTVEEPLEILARHDVVTSSREDRGESRASQFPIQLVPGCERHDV